MSSKPSVPSVMLAAWLVPGGGHYLLGRKKQAVVLLITITATFLAGMALADFTNVSTTRHPYYFLAHIFNGGEAMVAAIATAGLEPNTVPKHFGMDTVEIGTLYSAVAGLLNLIVMMDAFGILFGITPRPKKKKEKAGGEARA